MQYECDCLDQNPLLADTRTVHVSFGRVLWNSWLDSGWILAGFWLEF